MLREAFIDRQSRWWVVGLCVIIFINLVIILLPLFRGYYISDYADELNHLGMIKDISLTNHIGITNVYPLAHIISYKISLMCGLDSRIVIKILPSIFYLIYLMGLYLLARKISSQFGQVLLVMAFGSVYYLLISISFSSDSIFTICNSIDIIFII